MPRFALVVIIVGWLGMVAWANLTLAGLQARNVVPGLPFGVLATGDGELLTQDFAYNLAFLRGVEERRVEHPYQPAQQETLMRQMLPRSTGGMTHAYSPVALVVAAPLLALPGRAAYFVYTLVSGAAVVLLFGWGLLPRAESRAEIYALLIGAFNLGAVTTLYIGQSALFTTGLLGALVLLMQKPRRSLAFDAALALIFCLVCAKPNVALVPAALLIGVRAWRPLSFALLALAMIWALVAPYYGGWWAGLRDYAYLLNHYTDADMPAYLQRVHVTAAQAADVRLSFAAWREGLISAVGTLVVLHLLRRINFPIFFLGVLGSFLLLSPYVQSTESFALCLLVVNGAFFRSGTPVTMAAKLVLFAAILNLPGLAMPLRWLLFAWMAAELMLKNSLPANPDSSSSHRRGIQKSC